jgi:hypothetical protein
MTTEDKTYTKAELDKAVESERAHAQKFEDEAKEYKAKVDALSAKFKDIDVDKYNNTLKEINDLKKKDAGSDPAKLEALIEAARQEERERLDKTLKEKDDTLKNTSAELKRLKVIAPGAKLASEIFVNGALKYIEKEIEQFCEFDGEQIIIKDENGKVRFSPTDAKAKMTQAEFLSELAAANSDIVKSTYKGTSHTGGEQSSTAIGSLTVDKFIKLSPEERAKLPFAERVKLEDQYFNGRAS